MRRTKKATPDITSLPYPVNAILTADWHLRTTQPICRLDNFWETQWEKVDFIRRLQTQCGGCPVFHAGDLFDEWNPLPILITYSLLHLPPHFYTIYGNHDLHYHNLKTKEETGVHTLDTTGNIIVVDKGAHWGLTPKESSLEITEKGYSRKILMWHTMAWNNPEPWLDNAVDGNADLMIEQFKGKYDLIVTGHNHKSFVIERDGVIWVNPGSLTRQEADKDEHHPKVYLWSAEANKIYPIDIPIRENVITREHLTKKREREQRIAEFIAPFIERLQNNEGLEGYNFRENVDKFITKNKIPRDLQELLFLILTKAEGRK